MARAARSKNLEREEIEAMKKGSRVVRVHSCVHESAVTSETVKRHRQKTGTKSPLDLSLHVPHAHTMRGEGREGKEAPNRIGCVLQMKN